MSHDEQSSSRNAVSNQQFMKQQDLGTSLAKQSTLANVPLNSPRFFSGDI
jgi:hypothetical protein